MPSRRSSFFRCIQASLYLPRRERRSTSISSFLLLTLSLSLSSLRRDGGARADLPADWIRARFIRYFSRVAAKADGDYARRNTSRSAEAITMFPPSDEGSSDPPSARFSPRYAVSLAPLWRSQDPLFIPWHMLGPLGGSHKGNYSNVAVRENANSRSIGEAGLWAVFVCARHVDV